MKDRVVAGLEARRQRLRDTPEAWLTRRIEMIDTPGQALSSSRRFMMMLGHEVRHRSQIAVSATVCVRAPYPVGGHGN
jgi:uncharacterized damage-inducible protein DinB